MARRQVHSDEAILDAVRDLWVTGGRDAATIAAISVESGAPSGSIYHRFGSRDRVFAELWLRTIRRFQLGLLAAADSGEDPHGQVVAAAMWTVDFAIHYPNDARILLQASRRELLGTDPGPAIAEELDELNRPVVALLARLAQEVYGTTDSQAVEQVAVAVVDIPYAIVKRHLSSASTLRRCRPLVARTARAVLDAIGKAEVLA